MLKKILISVLSVLLFLIFITGTFRYAVKICDDYLLPESGIITEQELEDAKNKTVDYLFAVDPESAGQPATSAARSSYGSKGSGMPPSKSEYCVVIGTLLKEDKYYYSIYDTSGMRKAYEKFGTSLETCTIQDIRAGSDEIYILCEENGLCVLYSICFSSRVNGGAMKLSKKIEFNPQREGETLLKLLLPDDKMEYIVAAGAENAALYTVEGQLIKNYTYEPKKVISCGAFSNGTLLLCGAGSDEEDGQGFRYGYAEAFAEDGAQLWIKKLFDKENYISAAMDCQMKPNGNIGIYGRYFDYSESDFILTSLEPERYDDFKIYGNGIDYYIYTTKIRNDGGGAVQSSAFLAELDPQGSEVDLKVYSALNDYRVPSIAQTGSLNKMDEDGNFLLTIAQAKTAESDEYYLSMGGTSAIIPNYLNILYDLDQSGGVFVYLAESGIGIYKMKYFTSVEEFASGISKLRKALRISEALDILPEVMPWFLISVIGIILLAAKHYWRYDRSNEENS